MSKLVVENAITSLITRIFVQDTAATNGDGKSGLDHTSSGMKLSIIADNESAPTVYAVADSEFEAITTLGTFAAPSSGKVRFKEVHATDMKGTYELHIANAHWSVSGARSVQGMLFGASGAAPCLFEIQLHPAPANLTSILGTALTETVGGYLAAAFKKLFDVATPVLTAASINQTGDSFALLGAPSGASVSADLLTLLNRLTSTRAGLLDNLDVAISTLQSQISALNNLSAKANWFGNYLLEIPDSGTRAYVYELVIKDDEDKLVNLDALPTITLTNAAGTDRSALITTGIANTATGRYTLTITVGTSTTNEALTLRATGAVSAETRYAVWAMQVVDYDSAVLINSIYTRIGEPAGASIAADIAAAKTVIDSTSTTLGTVNTKLGTPTGVSMSADIAAIKTDTGNLVARITSTLFSGITSLADWLRRLARKDTGTAGMITAAGEIATGGTATYSGATDNLEAIYDNGGGGGGGGTDWTSDERTAIRNALGIPTSGTTLLDPTVGILDTIRDQVVANGTALAGTPISANSRVASGGTITAYIGDDFRVRSDTELSLSVSDVGGALYTKWTALGASALIFGASREGADVGAITGTVASITSVGSGSSQTCKLTVEISSCGTGLKPGSYEYQIEQRQTQGSDTDSFVEVAGTLTLKRNSVA